MKHIIAILSVLFTLSANADAVKTPCASEILANAVATVADGIDPFAEEVEVQTQIYAVFADKDILSNVLKCPEIARANETDTIKFTPIQYEFPNGREIIINYETQPKVIKQKIDLAGKRRLPSEDPNPRIGDINDDAMWTNTNPAWYAIMITQAGALRNFVGPDKNNTVSLQYIVDNIDSLYPSGPNGGYCTTRSPKGPGQNFAINRATEITTGNPDDYYYIAGDINLEWIGYAELAAEVVITIVTWGGWAAVQGAVKGARAMAALRKLSPILKTLEKSKDVKKYLSKTDELAKLTDKIADANKLKDAKQLKQLKQQKEALEKELKALDKIDDVKTYKKTAATFDDLTKYLDDLGALNKKATKVAKESNKLRKSYNTAKKTKDAQNYRKAVVTQQRSAKQLEELKKARKLLEETGEIAPDAQKINKNIANLEKRVEKLEIKRLNTKGSQQKDIQRQIKNLNQQINKQRNNLNTPKKLTGKDKQNALDALDQQIKTVNKNLDDATKSVKDLENLPDVKTYKEASKQYSDLVDLGQRMKNLKVLTKTPQRGNVFTRAARKIKGTKIVRGVKALKTAFSGGKKINKAARMGRTGSLAAKTRDWLFHSTLAAAGSLAKFEAQVSALYMIVNFAGDMFDFTNDSTSQFTNNIEFKPFLLLSASEIEGQEDVVNYGMWLMWAGDSTSAADDDAAFLMANDFAAKLHEDLTEYQKDKPGYPCNVDIYVVRPILRNPGEEDGQIYYLIMNDIPWTTAD